MPSADYRFKDGDLVAFDSGGLGPRRRGYVRGVAVVEQAVIGCLYMVEVIECDPPIPNEVYPFRYIAIPEVVLKKET